MECVKTTRYSIALNRGMFGSIEGQRGLRQGDPISPLLFVICMEYFSRIMIWVSEEKGFPYHTKCKGMKLNHLCFADNMLIFSKRDYQSVLLMLREMKSFLGSSGLTNNAAKSNIFSANMEQQELNDLCEVSGYAKGKLPFRYLGVPLSEKRLLPVLVERMASRVRTWG